MRLHGRTSPLSERLAHHVCVEPCRASCFPSGEYAAVCESPLFSCMPSSQSLGGRAGEE